MKMLPFLCLGWLLLAAVGGAHAQVPPARQETELRTDPYEGGYGKLDGHGKLVYQALYQDDYPTYWHDTFVYYPRGSRRGFALKGNLPVINLFLAAEIRRPGTVRAFFKEHLWHFLSTNLGESFIADLITQAGLDDNPDNYLVKADRGSKARRARRRAQLQAYARSGDAVVTGNGWTMDANVVTSDGAVEHWLVRGQMTPLRIDSFRCEPKEAPGTFEQAILIPG